MTLTKASIHNNAVTEGKKLNKCSICDYSFTTEGNLNNHNGKIHEEFNNNGIRQLGNLLIMEFINFS
jgi:hypothetical protein